MFKLYMQITIYIYIYIYIYNQSGSFLILILSQFYTMCRQIRMLLKNNTNVLTENEDAVEARNLFRT